MNDNSFLKILGLEYMDLSEIFPYFHDRNPDVAYYRKGKLNRFERELFLAESELFDRITDLSIEYGASIQKKSTVETSSDMIIDSDHHDAVDYMTKRATANYIPIQEEVSSLESSHRLCWGFLEKNIRERLNIPWAQGLVITKGYVVYWYFVTDLKTNEQEDEDQEFHEDDD